VLPTDRETEGQTDDIMMPIADYTMKQYDWLRKLITSVDLCFDVGVVAERVVEAEYCLDLTLCFVAEDWSQWVGVQEDATGRRNKRAAGECRVVEPGAVQIVTRAVNTATVQLPSHDQPRALQTTTYKPVNSVKT